MGSDGPTTIECRSRLGDEIFIGRIVDIIKCHKKEFLTTLGIVIDRFQRNCDSEKYDNIYSALNDSEKIF